MKRQILIGLFLLTVFCVASVSAQKSKKEKPNFSGMWILDESKSKDVIMELFKSSQKTVDSSNKITNQLVIGHNDPEFKLTEIAMIETSDVSGKLTEKKEKVFPSQKFFTDKRNEENVNEKDKSYKSTTVWKRKNIVIATNDGKKQTSITEFILSKDGKELTVITRSFLTQYDSVTSRDYFIGLPFGGKRVFKKVSE